MAKLIHLIYKDQELLGYPEFDAERGIVRVICGRDTVVIPMKEWKKCLVL
jgi:hypothetical protein